MIKISYNGENISQLSEELSAVPSFETVAKLSRERDSNGNLINVAPYLEIRGVFTAGEEITVLSIVSSHVPVVEVIDTKINIEELSNLLVEKNILTQGDIDDAKKPK